MPGWQPLPSLQVLTEKYEFNEQDANDMTEFLVPILDFVPQKRPTAAQLLLNPWINAGPRLLEPFIIITSDGNQAEGSAIVDDKKRENDEREAMEVGMGKIAISSDSKSVKDASSSVKPSMPAAAMTSSYRVGKDKRALKVAKRKLGIHKRAKKKREEMSNVLRKYPKWSKTRAQNEELRFWCQYWILVAILSVLERVGDIFISWY
ncbi:hypothetical protein CsatB_003037 [Cannabis sativa]